MSRFLFRWALLLALVLSVVTPVLAQDADASSLDKLLGAGSTQVAVSDVLLNETFDSSDAWEAYKDQDISAKVGKGVYRMSMTGNFFTWGLNSQVHQDVVIQAETLMNSANTNNSYGVICRADTANNGNGYYFRISGDGYYDIGKKDGDSMTQLVDWAQSSAVNQGQNRNHLTAVCVGNYLALYVNDEFVAETTDDSFSEGYAGFTVGAYEDTGDADVSFDNAVIWNASAAGSTTALSGSVATLQNFAGKSENAIKELEQDGIIPSGSGLVFAEDYAYFTGQGNFFTPLASDKPRKNIVMAGELTFKVGNADEFESCVLTSHINTDSRGTATTYIDVGFGNDGYAFIYDLFSESADGTFALSESTFDLKQPHHVLFTMLEDTANVYVDGALTIADFHIQPRAGTYGISLLGKGPNARCEGRNIWAYQVPFGTVGGCTVTADRTVNKRSGPGTSFSSAGQLEAGQDAIVVGQSKSKDGQTWWKLDDDSWVREDVVTELGDCASVPSTKA